MSRRWDLARLASSTAVADAICALYAERGHALYDEAVSQTTHGVQAAALAAADGAPPAICLAALLHDIGHLLERDPSAGDHPERDFHHELVGSRFLANWFGPEVTEPIRHHVSAKRYLVTVSPEYFGTLSAASVHSLALQGGPMTTVEAAAFIALPGADGAVALRRWDDQAKDPDRDHPPFADFRDLIESLCDMGGSTG